MPPGSLGKATMNVDVRVSGFQQLSRLHQILIRIANVTKQVHSNINVNANLKGQPGQQGQQGSGNIAAPTGPISDFTQRITDLRAASFALRDAGRQFTLFARQILSAFTPVVRVGAEFQQSMADVRSVISQLQEDTPLATMQVNDLSESILRLAEITEFTAAQIAEGAKQLALAGFSLNEIKASLQGVVDLATAGGVDIGESARITANILRAFQIEAQNATRVSDVLAQTQSNSNTTVVALGESFKMVSGTASALGISIEETAAAIGVLANAGTRGTLSGTGLNRMLMQLTNEGEKFDEVLRRWGSSFDAVDIRKRTLTEVFQEFERITSSSRQARFEIAAMFDMRAARTFLGILNQGVSSLENLVKLNDEAAGVAERIRQIRLNTLQGDVLLLKSAFETLLVETFKTFEKDLRSWVQYLTEAVRSTLEWVKANQELVRSLALFLGQIVMIGSYIAGTFLQVVGALTGTAAGLLVVFVSLNKALPLFLVSLQALPAVLANIASLAVKFLGLPGIIFGIVYAITQIFPALNVFKNSSASAAESAAIAFEKARRAISSIREELKPTYQAIEEFSKALEIIQKGGLASPSERRKLSEGPFSTDGQFDLNRANEHFSKINGKLKELRMERQELFNEIRDIEDRFWVSSRFLGGLKGEPLDAINRLKDQIRQYDDEIGKLSGAETRLRDQVELAEALLTIMSEAGGKINDARELIQKDISSLQDQLLSGLESGDLSDAEQKVLDNKILKLQTLLDAMGELTDEQKRSYENSFKDGKLDNALIDERIAKTEKLKDTVTKAEQYEKSLLTEKIDIAKELEKLRQNSYENQMSRIQDEIQAQDLLLEAAIKTKQAQIEAARDENIADSGISRLQDDILALQEQRFDLADLQNAQEKKIHTEQIARQESVLDNLELEKAKREKNFQEYERILRKIKKAEVDAEIASTFQTRDQGDIDKFKNLKNAELDALLATEKEAFEEKKELQEKENKEQSRELEIQDSILQSLKEQVSTLEQAGRLIAFIRMLERAREKDAMRGALNALSQRRRAEQAERDLANAGPGADLDMLRARAENERTRSNVLGGVFNKRVAAANLSGVNLAESLANAGAAVPNAADQIGQGMFNNIKTWIDNVAEAFRNAPGQWSAALLGALGGNAFGNLLSTVSGGPSLANMAGGVASSVTPGNTTNQKGVFTFNITNMTDAKNLQRMLESVIRTAGFKK